MPTAPAEHPVADPSRVAGAGPVRVVAGARSWPLHGAAASRVLEQDALAHEAPHGLMERAGLAVARLTLALAPQGGPIRIWAGPGNNGGDGLVAARHLHRAGVDVGVILLADAARQPADAAWALRQAQVAGVPIATALNEPRAAALVVDALLGLGLGRAPEGPLQAAIAALRAFEGPVLAVDLPSGLHADTGVPVGTQAVRATTTLALLTLKPGCHTGQGRDCAGDVWLDDLGIAAPPPSAWLSGGPAGADGPRRHATHKGSYGDVAVVGGAPGMAGALWLAAQAASAAGAGRVLACPLDADAALLDARRPELMGRHAWWLSEPGVLAATTVACGCGGGDLVRAALPPLLAHAARLVLDADALNAVARDGALQALMRARAARGRRTLLTPHPLEAARLLGCSAQEVQADRLAAAGRLAAAFGCAVVLKGSGSVIAAPRFVPHINPTGNAALASAGTGDVLAGWSAGLWAQEPEADAFDIAVRAAWTHGRAADRWAPAARGAPLRASDLVELLAGRDFA